MQAPGSGRASGKLRAAAAGSRLPRTPNASRATLFMPIWTANAVISFRPGFFAAAPGVTQTSSTC